MQNPNCDNSTENKCAILSNEVRVLPYGGGGNLILCRMCYLKEMRFRRERNQELAKDCQYDTPAWNDLKIYGQ